MVIFVAVIEQCAEERPRVNRWRLVFVDGLRNGHKCENVARLVLGLGFCCVGSIVSVFPVLVWVDLGPMVCV